MNKFKLMMLLAIATSSSTSYSSFKKIIKPTALKAIQRNMSLTYDKTQIIINELEGMKNQLLTDYIKHSKNINFINHSLADINDIKRKFKTLNLTSEGAQSLLQENENKAKALTKSLPNLKTQHKSMATAILRIQQILINEIQLQEKRYSK